jgi:DNA-binding transcriptional ArsR family regulator
MKAMKVITDPNAFQLLADETRRRMIYLLRVKEMTVSQIAEQMHLTTQAIYHHIRKLKDAGMIDIAREERVGHFIETYYQASAEVFHIAHGADTPKADMEAIVKAALEGLDKLGYEVECTPATIKGLVKASSAVRDCFENDDIGEKALNETGADFLTQQNMIEYASLLQMNDKEFDEHIKHYKAFRDKLVACVKPPKKKKGK